MRRILLVYVAVALVWAGVGAELVETGSVACDFPSKPQYLQPPVCPPTTLTRDNATAIAWQFAPEMRFHSLEEAFLLDPSVYFAQVRSASGHGYTVHTIELHHYMSPDNCSARSGLRLHVFATAVYYPCGCCLLLLSRKYHPSVGQAIQSTS